MATTKLSLLKKGNKFFFSNPHQELCFIKTDVRGMTNVFIYSDSLGNKKETTKDYIVNSLT